jgi:hypothetical protein
MVCNSRVICRKSESAPRRPAAENSAGGAGNA